MPLEAADSGGQSPSTQIEKLFMKLMSPLKYE